MVDKKEIAYINFKKTIQHLNPTEYSKAIKEWCKINDY